MNLKEVRERIGMDIPCQFDGDGHVFTFKRADGVSYERAQRLAAQMMEQPKANRPRGWSRGTNLNGDLFVCIRLH